MNDEQKSQIKKGTERLFEHVKRNDLCITALCQVRMPAIRCESLRFCSAISILADS